MKYTNIILYKTHNSSYILHLYVYNYCYATYKIVSLDKRHFMGHRSMSTDVLSNFLLDIHSTYRMVR